MENKIKVSYYHNGTSKKPYAQIPISDINLVLTSGHFISRTEQLRQIKDEDYRHQFEVENFPVVRFSGTFDNKGNLLEHSGLLCLQFLNLPAPEKTRIQLLFDKYFEPQLLFSSPAGSSLNWVVRINTNGQFTHEDYFKAISIYLRTQYQIEPEKTGRDVAFGCSIAFEPNAFIKPEYIGEIMEGFPFEIYQVERKKKFQPGRWLGKVKL